MTKGFYDNPPLGEQTWLTGCPECGLPDGCDCYGEITINELEEEVDNMKLELAASQAREAKLRELLTQFELWESYDDPETPIKDALAHIDTDDTALKEAIKQAKREALLEAAEWFDNNPYHHFTNDSASKLRRMAEELK
jgi:hypothetical protein